MKMYYFPVTFCMVMGVWMLMLRNPLMVGMALFSQCFLYSISLSYMYNSWFAMILFLVYIGGLLVLLMYTILTTCNYYITSLKAHPLSGLLMFSLSLSPYMWFESSEVMKGSSLMISQGNNMSLTLIVMLGILLFYSLVMVVHILHTGGKSLEVARAS